MEKSDTSVPPCLVSESLSDRYRIAQKQIIAI